MKEIDAMHRKKRDLTVRLPNFLQLVRVVAFLTVFIFLFLVWFFPSYFDFIVERKLFLNIMIGFAIINAIFSYFIPHLVRLKVFYSAYLYNILWVLFYVSILYTMGGITSFLVITMIFPILTTAFDLDARAALILGVITEVLFAGLMFADTRVPHTGSYYVVGLLSMLTIGIFSVYLYSIITEGVRERFEKEETKRKYFDLAEVDRAKTTFLTVTSHQLQTPLSKLRWAINSVLEKKQWDHEVEDTLNESRESIAKLVDIVSSIIQTSQLGIPELEYERVPVDISRMIDLVLQDLKLLADQEGVVVKLEGPTGACIVHGDRSRLRSAF